MGGGQGAGAHAAVPARLPAGLSHGRQGQCLCRGAGVLRLPSFANPPRLAPSSCFWHAPPENPPLAHLACRRPRPLLTRPTPQAARPSCSSTPTAATVSSTSATRWGGAAAGWEVGGACVRVHMRLPTQPCLSSWPRPAAASQLRPPGANPPPSPPGRGEARPHGLPGAPQRRRAQPGLGARVPAVWGQRQGLRAGQPRGAGRGEMPSPLGCVHDRS